MSVQQRFCPLCDRAFDQGEAVLRCTGCAVLHHPGCWVANNGCATQQPHESSPQAMAYPGPERSPGTPAPHPGEGTRTAPLPPPIPFPPGEPGPAATPESGSEPVIGNTFVRRQLPEDVAPPIGSGPRRYQPPPHEPLVRKPMPRIYDRHRWLGYWYVPAAVVLAIGVAFGIILAADRLTGDPAASPDPTPTPLDTATPTPTPVGAAFTTPTPAGTPALPTPALTPGPGRFSTGQRLVVTDTGGCLNVRTSPGIQNDAIVCLPDGSEVRVTGGPEQAGDFTWWKVQTTLGEGWAVEIYLAPAP